MLNELAKIISGLFEGLDIRRRWITFFAAILGLIAIGLLLEYVTGLNFYFGLERKVNLLKELNTLAKDGITTHPELNQIYQQTISELGQREVHPLTVPVVGITNSVEFWKFFSGALVGLFFMVTTLIGLVKVDDKRSTILGSLIVAIVFGIIGLVIPTIVNPWVNYIGMPILEYLTELPPLSL